MAKAVGFGNGLKLNWLNMAFELRAEHLSDAECRERLTEYLAPEISSPTRLEKIRSTLQNIWCRSDAELVCHKDWAAALLDKSPDYASAIHLCLIYLAYPVFADICRFMGRIFEFQDEVTTAGLKRKLYDEWGERGTLENTSRAVTLTLKHLGFLVAKDRLHSQLSVMEIKHDEITNFLLASAMLVDGGSYYALSDLQSFYTLFPFKYQVSKQQLMSDERFAIGNFGGTFSVALKKI